MIVVMNSSATEENVKNVENIITSAGLHVHLSKGEETTIIGIVGDKTRVNTETLQAADGVEKIIQVTESYKLANRKFHPANTVIKVGGKDTDAVTIGGDQFVIYRHVIGMQNVKYRDAVLVAKTYLLKKINSRAYELCLPDIQNVFD